MPTTSHPVLSTHPVCGMRVRFDNPTEVVPLSCALDVDGIVAWWLNACLRGDMSAEHLLASLDELDTELPPEASTARLRLATLRNDVQAILAKGDQGIAGVESAAVRFLGEHPARVVEARGARLIGT